MSLPNTKTEFKDYIKRRMGGDYVPVEISPQQFDDIVDESLRFFATNVYGYSKDVVYRLQANSYLVDPTGSTTIKENTRQYILPDEIFSVVEIVERSALGNFGLLTLADGVSTKDIEWIFSLGEARGGFIDMEVNFENLEMFKTLFIPKYQYLFNYNLSTLFMYTTPREDELILLCNKLIGSTENGKLWSDKYLIDYTYYLANKYWYNNISKYRGALPGNIELNIDKIKEESEKLKEFEDWLRNELIDPEIYSLRMA